MIKRNLNSFYNLVQTLEQIPSIGKKTAQRLAYTLSIENKDLAKRLSHTLNSAIQTLQKCKVCQGLSEEEECHICLDESRQNGQLCILGHLKDIAIIEELNIFNGIYFVLDNLELTNFSHLHTIVQERQIQEVIFGFSPSLANDALMLFVEDQLSCFSLTFSKIAQGVPTGIGLDHIDHLSLVRAFQGRIKV